MIENNDKNDENLEPDFSEEKSSEKPDIDELAKSFSIEDPQAAPPDEEIPELDDLAIEDPQEAGVDKKGKKSDEQLQEINISDEVPSLDLDIKEESVSEKQDEETETDKLGDDAESLDLESIFLDDETDEKEKPVPEDLDVPEDSLPDEEDGGVPAMDVPDIPSDSMFGEDDTSGAPDFSPEEEPEKEQEVSQPEPLFEAPGDDSAGDMDFSLEEPEPEQKIPQPEPLFGEEETPVDSETREESASVTEHEPAPKKSKKEVKKAAKTARPRKKSKVPLLLFILAVGAGLVYYFGFLQKEKSRVAAGPPRPRPVTKLMPEADKTTPQVDIPYVYPRARNVQKDVNEGVVTYVYEASNDVSSLHYFYKNRMASMEYTVKSDECKMEEDYAYLVFVRDGKNLSVFIKKSVNKTNVIVSYVE